MSQPQDVGTLAARRRPAVPDSRGHLRHAGPAEPTAQLVPGGHHLEGSWSRAASTWMGWEIIALARRASVPVDRTRCSACPRAGLVDGGVAGRAQDRYQRLGFDVAAGRALPSRERPLR